MLKIDLLSDISTYRCHHHHHRRQRRSAHAGRIHFRAEKKYYREKFFGFVINVLHACVTTSHTQHTHTSSRCQVEREIQKNKEKV